MFLLNAYKSVYLADTFVMCSQTCRLENNYFVLLQNCMGGGRDSSVGKLPTSHARDPGSNPSESFTHA